ncbi:MAG TPA: class II fumarate hydratase [Thermomicrobiales bacterium]|nr:class II fumarate hydratase [Thermomicrobiales bacterium]
MTSNTQQYRTERDTMGEMQVPADALYAAQTQRAVENFPVSGITLPSSLIAAIGAIKSAAARTNADLGLLDQDIAEAVIAAADRVAANELDGEFPIDIFQTGSGTSSNMNANEVIATLASRALGKPVSPNDHVNMGQSSNDTFPGALHVAAVVGIEQNLIPALGRLQDALAAKSEQFDGVVKIGRTHLMDAVPIRLGQEFSGYARQVELGVARLQATLVGLRELAIGGTAVGTGLNTHRDFGSIVAGHLSTRYGTEFTEAVNHFEAQASQDAYVFAAGGVTSVASSLIKIANDIRLLASGPQAGLGEIILPAVQPGSSIMPGKVNPVISESVIQLGIHVTGSCQAVVGGGQWGQLDLNVMLPMMAHNLLGSIRMLANACDMFVGKCIVGIEANVERCASYIEGSISMATALNPLIGYAKSAEIAKRSYATGTTVRELAYEMSGLTREQVDEALDPYSQTVAGTITGGAGG